MINIVIDGFNLYKKISELESGDTFIIDGKLYLCLYNDLLNERVEYFSIDDKIVDYVVTPEGLNQTVRMVDCTVIVYRPVNK